MSVTALLWMVNPIWEGLIAPLILVLAGYWARPRIEQFFAKVDEIDRLNRVRFPDPPSHVRPMREPYDWEMEGD